MKEVFECKTTFESFQDAQNFAEMLLDKKLIACAQICEIESHYVWQEKREIAKEFLVVGKTTRKKLKLLQKQIAQNHPYDLPEIVVIKCRASKKYFQWVKQNTES